MADCHYLFQNFNGIIRLTEQRRQALLTAREDLRNRILNGFETIKLQLPTVHEIQFQSQGSFVMDTIVNPISEDYDLDDGVYFIGNTSRAQRPATKYFHDFIIQCISTNNFLVEKVIDKETCVRAMYKEGFTYMFEKKSNKLSRGFHVDLPSYYAGNKKCPDLAHLTKSWIVSDPIEFIQWFEDQVKSNFRSEFLYEKRLFSTQYQSWRDQQRKDDAQLRRIVRYLKAWCDFKGSKMPCGIVMTILGAENYVADTRDDVSLNKTLINIKVSLDKAFICKRPTTPKGDDLLAEYEYGAHFKEKLAEFVINSTQAINETNAKNACGKWQINFGDRFSCAIVPREEEKAAKFTSPAIITSNAKSA